MTCDNELNMKVLLEVGIM